MTASTGVNCPCPGAADSVHVEPCSLARRVPRFVDPLLDTSGSAIRERTTGPLPPMPKLPAAHKLADGWFHLGTCNGCDVPFGCAPQWQPEEMGIHTALGPKDSFEPNRIHVCTCPGRNRIRMNCPVHGIELGAPVIRPPALRPKNSAERKREPIHSAPMVYWPDALAALARLCLAGNEKHNPGEPLHWARGKSTDHMDCAARHMLTPEVVDPETGETELTQAAWRLLCQLQLQQERLLRERGIMPYSGITE